MKAKDGGGYELTERDLDAIVGIALRRAQLMKSLRDALQAGDDNLSLKLARQACGLEPYAPN